ncbi:MAG: hypothetical protein IME99_08965 [Proteobacteria bacterium]|nr:hypothetical protein [Pseudomonadota bacterium]
MKLAEGEGTRESVPVAIEMSGTTLKEVNRIDPGFVAKLAELWQGGRCEFIGSGLSQAILPLIPVEVNRWNLAAGNRVYEELLGQRPKTALVNEQTYSKGLVDLYTEAGYETIIMDWNNPFQYNRYPEEYRYFPQIAEGFESSINVLWSNSIAFQKFQRTVHNELTENEYLEYLFERHSSESERAFVLYCNDAEVFDYRPGSADEVDGEYSAVVRLLGRIGADERVRLQTPGAIVEHFKGDDRAFKRIGIESVEMPVVTKKQGKYNPVRWAVAGRDSTHINTECHKLYDRLREIAARGEVSQEVLGPIQERLVELWGSDFRTNTIDEKFLNFHQLLGSLKTESEGLLVENAGMEQRAESVPPSMGDADARAEILSTESLFRVSTEAVVAEFLPGKGLAIKGLTFPGVSVEPLVGTLEHGFYEDMRLGADFFSGHIIHLTRDAVKATDLVRLVREPDVKECSDTVKVEVKLDIAIGTLWKSYTIYKSEPKVELTCRLKVNALAASSLRLGIFTMLPGGFDSSTLWYEAVNGGSSTERFYVEGHEVMHDTPATPGVTASACLGATDGIVSIGDRDKSVTITTDKSQLYSVPMISYKDVDGSFFFRLYHSVGEVDDTAWWVWRGYNEITFTVTARKEALNGRDRC